MNQLKILEKLNLQIYDILDQPRIYFVEDANSKEKKISVYSEFMPVNTNLFFIHLSALLNETNEKNNLLSHFDNKSEQLFRYINKDKHYLTANDIDRILIDRNCNDYRDWWILNTYLFALKLKTWIQEKQESLRIEKVKQLNISVRKIEKQISTAANKNFPNEEVVKTEIAKIIKPLQLEGFVKKIIKMRDEYISHTLIDKKLSQKGCHAAFYWQIFNDQKRYFIVLNGKYPHFIDLQNVFDVIFCINTKNYKPNDLSELTRYLQDRPLINQISKAQ